MIELGFYKILLFNGQLYKMMWRSRGSPYNPENEGNRFYMPPGLKNHSF
jgi:hypothetical protein